MTEEIQIIIKAEDQFSETFKKLNLNLGNITNISNKMASGMGDIINTIKPVQQQLVSLSEALKHTSLSTKQWNMFLRDNSYSINAQGQLVDVLSGNIVKHEGVLRKAVAQTRRFKMEWLSVMFAGMALDRAFAGIINSQMQLYGITDLLASMWTTVMLPAMDLITPKLYKIIEMIMNLPSEVQTVIGISVLGLDVLGKTLGFIAQLYLAAQGIKMLFPEFGATIARVWAGIGLSTLAIVALIGWVVVAAISAWKNNFLGFRDAVIGVWEAVKSYFTGWAQFFKGIWTGIVGFFTMNTEKMKLGFSMMGEGIKNIFKGIANFIINIINTMVGLIISSLSQTVRLIGYLWNKVSNKKVTWYEDIVKMGSGKNLIPSFATGGIMPYTGLAMVHAGEQIIPSNQVGSNSNSIVISPVYNINVSDKSEIERLLKENNIKLVAEVQRQISI